MKKEEQGKEGMHTTSSSLDFSPGQTITNIIDFMLAAAALKTIIGKESNITLVYP